MPKEKSNARVATLDAAKLDDYRTRKGWDDATLADRSRVSERTIARARGGQPIRIKCIDLLAKALGVPCYKIMPETDATPPEARPRMWVLLQLELPVDDFINTDRSTELHKLLGALKAFGFIQHGTPVAQAFHGSVLIAAYMTKGDIHRLATAYLRGDLSSLAPISFTICEDSKAFTRALIHDADPMYLSPRIEAGLASITLADESDASNTARLVYRYAPRMCEAFLRQDTQHLETLRGHLTPHMIAPIRSFLLTYAPDVLMWLEPFLTSLRPTTVQSNVKTADP